MQWLNLRFLSFFHSLLRSASVLFSLCVRFSNVSLTCTDMCPPISISPCAQKVLRFGFSLFFLFWLCFVYWTTWDSWLSVVVVGVGVADTRNFVCGDDSYPLYASISVSLGRGWWGRFEGKGEFRVASSFFITNLPNRRCHILWDITQMPQNWNNNYNKICWILIAELRTILHKASVCVCVWAHNNCIVSLRELIQHVPHALHMTKYTDSSNSQWAFKAALRCVCVCVCEVDLGTFALQTGAWCWFFSRHKSAVVCLDSFAWKSYG